MKALPPPNALGKTVERKQETGLSNFFQNLFREDDQQDKGATIHETSKGHWIRPKVFASYLDKGCVYCGKIPNEKEVAAKDLVWISTNQYLCLDCSTNPDLPKHIH